jgi:hypothetical protein
MGRKVDEAANFVLVQLTEPGIYDKRHPDYARRDKVGFEIKNMSAKTMQTTTTV